MNRIDDVLRDFKEFGYIDELKNISSLDDKFKRISEVVSKVNTLKSEMSELTADEQLYLRHGLQKMGVDLELCPFFYIFYSNKYGKFHHYCRRDDEQRQTSCRGETNSLTCKKRKNNSLFKHRL
jgi:hypothetical protein